MTDLIKPNDQTRPSGENKLADALAAKLSKDFQTHAPYRQVINDLSPLPTFDNAQKTEFVEQVAKQNPGALDTALGFAHAHFGKDGSVVFDSPSNSSPDHPAIADSGTELSYQRPQNENVSAASNPEVNKWTERLAQNNPVTDEEIRSMGKLLYPTDPSLALSGTDRDQLINAVRSRVDNDTFWGEGANPSEELYLGVLLPGENRISS
jgi:hypothetical protein